MDDSWRASNRLILNFGVRYELLTPPYEVLDRWSNFNLKNGDDVLRPHCRIQRDIMAALSRWA